jgi:hypothetical protein
MMIAMASVGQTAPLYTDFLKNAVKPALNSAYAQQKTATIAATADPPMDNKTQLPNLSRDTLVALEQFDRQYAVPAKQVKAAYDSMDSNGNGQVSKAELNGMLNTLAEIARLLKSKKRLSAEERNTLDKNQETVGLLKNVQGHFNKIAAFDNEADTISWQDMDTLMSLHQSVKDHPQQEALSPKDFWALDNMNFYRQLENQLVKEKISFTIQHA